MVFMSIANKTLVYVGVMAAHLLLSLLNIRCDTAVHKSFHCLYKQKLAQQ